MIQYKLPVFHPDLVDGAPLGVDHGTEVGVARDKVQHDLRRAVLAPLQLRDAIAAP